MNTKLSATAVVCLFSFYFNTANGRENTNGTDHVLSVDMGHSGCSISVVDFYRGHLESAMIDRASYWSDTPPVRSTIGDFSINFKCNANQNVSETAKVYGASWSSAEKYWVPYYGNEDDKKLLSSVSKVYQLRSKNSSGFLRTTDQINGAESQRVRFYTFCLFHDTASVCGSGQSMRLEEPKGNYLPYILRVLRSVSFMDSQPGKDRQ
ncbi:hypothetical protein [Paraburkholderia caribensis]|uniref:hypothetical protein n=1 Tax=Paraburkholderia TaxID=1822464 RepID=UPI001CAC2D7F|nr:hypothetical protein [Paraburkholderia caribensis]BEU23213.1 hypothetical protein PBP221_33530 [Paraburkholderia sp. 22B1P]CAG9251193.1 conserved exported hypothetical protein [Paraburkholderia caribensis]